MFIATFAMKLKGMQKHLVCIHVYIATFLYNSDIMILSIIIDAYNIMANNNYNTCFIITHLESDCSISVELIILT